MGSLPNGDGIKIKGLLFIVHLGSSSVSTPFIIVCSRFELLSSQAKMASSRFRPGRQQETVGGQPMIAPALNRDSGTPGFDPVREELIEA
jgi:hypothetical protein